MKEAEQTGPSPIAGVVFSLIGISLALYGWIAWGWTTIDSSEWPQVTGKVTKSLVVGDIFDLRYVFQVDGKEYSSKRIDYAAGRSNWRGSLRSSQSAKKYPLGKEVTVYYDPSKPSRAVLIKGSSNQYGKLAIIFGVLFALFPACGLLKRLMK